MLSCDNCLIIPWNTSSNDAITGLSVINLISIFFTLFLILFLIFFWSFVFFSFVLLYWHNLSLEWRDIISAISTSISLLCQRNPIFRLRCLISLISMPFYLLHWRSVSLKWRGLVSVFLTAFYFFFFLLFSFFVLSFLFNFSREGNGWMWLFRHHVLDFNLF